MELTKEIPIMQFEEVYAVKLLTGVPFKITYDNGVFNFPNFDEDRTQWLKDAILAFGVPKIEIDMVFTDHNRLFVVDVRFNDSYIAVPYAASAASYLKFKFPHFKKIKTDSLRRIRKYSPVELRPLDEFVLENGDRLIHRYVRPKKETK